MSHGNLLQRQRVVQLILMHFWAFFKKLKTAWRSEHCSGNAKLSLKLVYSLATWARSRFSFEWNWPIRAPFRHSANSICSTISLTHFTRHYKSNSIYQNSMRELRVSRRAFSEVTLKQGSDLKREEKTKPKKARPAALLAVYKHCRTIQGSILELCI